MSEWNAEIAEWYADKYGDYATNRLAVEALELAPDAVVVDVGCGTGSALRHAAVQVTEGTLIGVDLVPRMIEIARERTASHPASSRIELRVGAAEDLPIEGDAADVVLAFDSFDHWRDGSQGLAEIRRVLRPEGRFVAVKDHDVPGSTAARHTFIEALVDAGFEVRGEQQLEGDGVTFTMWVCTRGQ